MRAISVRKRRGRRRHAVSENSDCPRDTLCGKNADGYVVDERGVDCPQCLEEVARLRWSLT